MEPKQTKLSSTVGTNTRTAKVKSDKGFVAGVGAGYVVNEFVRTDLMLQARKSNTKTNTILTKGSVMSRGAMLNAYLTGHNDTIFTPYVMVGAGLGQNSAKIKNGTNKATLKKTGLIWNAGLGCQAKVHDNVSVDLAYRYVSLGTLGKKTLGTGATANTFKFKKLASNEIVAGLVYNF